LASLASSPCWCFGCSELTVISTEEAIVAGSSHKIRLLDQWLDVPSYTL
jgi:hypothetical protein